MKHPVTFGVPFADGELERGTPVTVLDPSGTAIPLQTQCLTTWSEIGKFVKWLLVDFQADLPERGEKGCLLKFLEDNSNPAPGHTVAVKESGDSISVDTGALKLRCRSGDGWMYWDGWHENPGSCARYLARPELKELSGNSLRTRDLRTTRVLRIP